MSNKKPVLIVLGEPNSVFTEILAKTLNKTSIKNKIKFPIIIIGSHNLIYEQLKVINKKLPFKILEKKNKSYNNLKNIIYLIDIKYKFKKPFEPISNRSNEYISKCFEKAFTFLNSGHSNIIINGPISKKHFLNKKYPGVTEFIFDKSKKKISKNPVMLIFNKDFSVSPITTHIPIKYVNKRIKEKIIFNNISIIDKFYKKTFNIKPKIAILGLNPHCETTSKVSEESKIIIPTIKKLKKKRINVEGPYSADTFFIEKNIKKFNSVVGMYHDQVLTPFKTLFNFDASNITLGLPFLRASVDHGPNTSMLGKNKSNTQSLENIFSFISKIK